MIRVIVETSDAGMAANVGGSVHTWHRIFDIESPELESFLRQELGTYAHRQVIGIEVPAAKSEAKSDG